MEPFLHQFQKSSENLPIYFIQQIKITSMDFSYLSPPPAVHSISHPASYIYQIVKGKQIRRIFYNVPYTQSQVQFIKTLRKHLLQHRINHSFDDTQLLKFCYAGDFDLEKSLQKFHIYKDWMNDSTIQNPGIRPLQILEDGIFYCYGRDFEFRPIIVFNIARMNLLKYKVQDYYAALNILTKPIIQYMFVPGKIENWVWIVDTESKLNLPVTSATTVIQKMGAVYSSILHKLFVVNSNSLIWLMYKGIKPFIHQHTTEKIEVLTSDEMGRLLEFIPADQLEMKFGGKLPDLTVYWPIKSTNKLVFEDFIQPQIIQSRIVEVQEPDAIESDYFSIINEDDRFIEEAQINGNKCCCNESSCLLF